MHCPSAPRTSVPARVPVDRLRAVVQAALAACPQERPRIEAGAALLLARRIEKCPATYWGWWVEAACPAKEDYFVVAVRTACGTF
jgi:hypothetical protein